MEIRNEGSGLARRRISGEFRGETRKNFLNTLAATARFAWATHKNTLTLSSRSRLQTRTYRFVSKEEASSFWERLERERIAAGPLIVTPLKTSSVQTNSVEAERDKQARTQAREKEREVGYDIQAIAAFHESAQTLYAELAGFDHNRVLSPANSTFYPIAGERFALMIFRLQYAWAADTPVGDARSGKVLPGVANFMEKIVAARYGASAPRSVASPQQSDLDNLVAGRSRSWESCPHLHPLLRRHLASRIASRLASSIGAAASRRQRRLSSDLCRSAPKCRCHLRRPLALQRLPSSHRRAGFAHATSQDRSRHHRHFEKPRQRSRNPVARLLRRTTSQLRIARTRRRVRRARRRHKRMGTLQQRHRLQCQRLDRSHQPLGKPRKGTRRLQTFDPHPRQHRSIPNLQPKVLCQGRSLPRFLPLSRRGRNNIARHSPHHPRRTEDANQTARRHRRRIGRPVRIRCRRRIAAHQHEHTHNKSHARTKRKSTPARKP